MTRQVSSGLVGRTAEISALDELIALTAAGTGGVVLLAGEPGIGKTRLAAEATERADAAGLTVAWGRCRESEGAPPLWPWLQVLRRLGRSARGVDASDGPEARFAQFEQILEWLREAATSAPLLVLLDDVHRADETSLRLLAFLGELLWPAPVGLVAAYRDVELAAGSKAATVVAGLARARGSRRCTLSGLSRAQVQAWLAQAFEPGAGVSPDDVYESTGGNPLFVTETIRLLLDGQSGHAVLPSAQEVIVERLALLPVRSREALEVASVLGRDFEYPPLAAAIRPVRPR